MEVLILLGFRAVRFVCSIPRAIQVNLWAQGVVYTRQVGVPYGLCARRQFLAGLNAAV